MNTPETALKLINWYFDEGKSRPEEYQLGLGTWLRSVFELQKESLITEDELKRSRNALAIWGPSQAGKSTLFKKYVDKGAQPNGEDSAMQWEESKPIRFTRDLENSPPGCLTWNPYALGADASACITRFTMREEVSEPGFPVEIKLASHEQIIHAIASGYLSECKLDEVGEKRFWDDDSLFEELKKLIGDNPDKQEVKKNSFEILWESVRLLKVMTELKLDRYCKINDFTLSQILEYSPLLSDERSVLGFIQLAFWDSFEPLNQLRENLHEMVLKIENLKPEKNSIVHCSYEVARLINDMAAYSRMTGGTNSEGHVVPQEQREETRNEVSRISYESRNGRLLIGFDLPNKLVQKDEDFAVLQGVVWELTVPLRKDRLARHNPPILHDLLKDTDLLDFPGVAKGGSLANEDRLTTETLSNETGHHLLFSSVLKRGKTSSIAISSGRESKIDGFSILTKVDEHIANPEQITQGVRVWWKSATGTDFSDAKAPILPLNLVLTFFAGLTNKVISDPDNPNIPQYFDKFKALGGIFRPEIVNFFATNYFDFEGFFHTQANRAATSDEIRKAMDTIKNVETVTRLFRRNSDSLSQVFKYPQAEEPDEVGDGGVDFFIQSLIEQSTSSNRLSLLKQKESGQVERLTNLLEEACPADGEESILKQQKITQWRDRILQKVEADSYGSDTVKTGAAIRKLFAMDPEGLRRVPLRIISKRKDPKKYIRDQLARWRNQKESFAKVEDLCVATTTELGQLLRYITDSVNYKRVSAWITENYRDLTDLQYSRRARRYVAIKLADELSGRWRLQQQQHRGNEEARESLVRSSRKSAEFEYQTSPHYEMIILPFIKNLEIVAESPGEGRPVLPGDAFLRELSSESCALKGQNE